MLTLCVKIFNSDFSKYAFPGPSVASFVNASSSEAGNPSSGTPTLSPPVTTLKLNNPDTFTLRDISTASEAGASGNNGPVKKRMVRARHLGQSMRQHISLP